MVLNTGGASGKPKAVNITLVLDRSGSMEEIRSDVIGGVNQFIAEQQDGPGEARLTLIMFDTNAGAMDYVVLYAGRDISEVPRLTTTTFVPRGSTPLYDALGRAIEEIDARTASEDVQLLAVFSDGKNNASRKHTKAQIFEMISAREKQGWVIALMMANADAYAEGSSMGFTVGNTQAYAGDSGGTQLVYASFSANTTALRGAAAGGQSVNSTAFFDQAGKSAEKDLLERKPEDPAALGVTDTADAAE